MGEGASAGGEAFELLAARYLCGRVGLSFVASPFYKRLRGRKWVQFDGLVSRDGGATLGVEAKFHDKPVSLATPGIAARIAFAKELPVEGIILVSRTGFHRDIMRLRLPIEKILLSWPGMRKRLSAPKGSLLTCALDVVTPEHGGFRSESGAFLAVADSDRLHRSRDGFVFLPSRVERWVRRLPVSTRDLSASSRARAVAGDGTLDHETAWAIEDSLRGFAPSDPVLLEKALAALRSGPLGLAEAWKALWRRGYRGKKGGLKNALENLCVIGAAEKFVGSRGLFYSVRAGSGKDKNAGRGLRFALLRWPALAYFRRVSAGMARDKNALAAHLSAAFAPLYPYARSLYNPAKVAGLIALENYLGSTSSVRPS